MRRRLFTAMSLVSGVLSVAVVIDWTCLSGWTLSWSAASREDWMPPGSVDDNWLVESADGRLSIARWRGYSQHGNVTMPAGSLNWTGPGVSFEDVDIVQWAGPHWWKSTLEVSHWLLAALTAVLPACWLVLLYRRRRRTGCCPACGYDLRGSPGTCPECGASTGRTASSPGPA